MRVVKLFLMMTMILVLNSAYSQVFLDTETGGVWTGYNDVRIPSKGGTMISLKDDLTPDTEPFIRLRGGYTFLDKHTVSMLYAPLTVEGEGTLKKDVKYQKETFSKGEKVKSEYTFNSYRLTYRYMIVNNDSFLFGLGLTAKIRDAEIKLTSGSKSASTKSANKTNIGFVPIVNFYAEYKLPANISVVAEGDALAAPQGRAEDIFAGLHYKINDNFKIKAGYRMLEGGSEGGGDVYTFSMFNYAAVGVIASY